ncbi:phosphoribosyltransferase [Sulfurisphaera tokodaii]|uniref:Purine phosphoribosyltransferase n=2 Tax=Sulfurisphaera tokodaii TaxID=111955 RepID=F9VN02_SULTO|nr:phosphoribosyltransferase [Sulfurisphaera tokodaii]BAK54299.1 putative purine phosphoribosyltransferase [Sulfurisphaera tokodaii str. 7]HII74824.1 phosphoribosyltransferase [Sulfurisphaera tokodaii]
MPKIPVKVVKWEEVVDWSTQLAEKIKESKYDPDIIIAIARGGLVPARIVADVLGVIDILSIKIEHWVETASHTPEAKVKYPFKVDLQGKKVLIIDDITDTGDSVELAKKYVKENFGPKEVRTATMQIIEASAKIKPDYYAMVIKDWYWFMYPWNYWEDEINLIRKILTEENDKAIDTSYLKAKFIESYGVEPPIPVEKILTEMKRRNLL